MQLYLSFFTDCNGDSHCGGFLIGRGQWKPERPWTGQMVLCSFFQLPMFAFELSSENHTKKTADKTALLTHTRANTRVCVCRMRTFVCVCLEVVIRLWRWCLCIEGSCPVCQRALSATLFSDKASVKGLTPTGHGCWGRVVAAATAAAGVGVGSSSGSPAA